MQQTVDYILTLPKFHTKDGNNTYFSYSSTTRYESVAKFKELLNNNATGRHEVFLTKNIVKGYIFDNNDNNTKIFYECNLHINMFCMWTNLNDQDVKSWLKTSNKLLNRAWIHNSSNNSNNGSKSHTHSHIQLLRLVIFRQNKYYIHQRDDSKRYDCDYYDGANKIIFVYYDKLTDYQQVGNIKRLSILKTLKFSIDFKHRNIVLYRDNDKILEKEVTSSGNYRHDPNDFCYYESNIQDDKLHGISRSWKHLNDKQLRIWEKYLYVPMNAFHDNLTNVESYVLGEEHGMSFIYDKSRHTSQMLYHRYDELCYRVEYNSYQGINSICHGNDKQQYYWNVEYKYGTENRTLYYHDTVIRYTPEITMYLGLYLLCRDGYVICHDNKVNRFLTFFDRLSPELAELILSKLTGHNQIHINKSFTLAGIDLLYTIPKYTNINYL